MCGIKYKSCQNECLIYIHDNYVVTSSSYYLEIKTGQLICILQHVQWSKSKIHDIIDERVLQILQK